MTSGSPAASSIRIISDPAIFLGILVGVFTAIIVEFSPRLISESEATLARHVVRASNFATGAGVVLIMILMMRPLLSKSGVVPLVEDTAELIANRRTRARSWFQHNFSWLVSFLLVASASKVAIGSVINFFNLAPFGELPEVSPLWGYGGLFMAAALIGAIHLRLDRPSSTAP